MTEILSLDEASGFVTNKGRGGFGVRCGPCKDGRHSQCDGSLCDCARVNHGMGF